MLSPCQRFPNGGTHTPIGVRQGARGMPAVTTPKFILFCSCDVSSFDIICLIRSIKFFWTLFWERFSVLLEMRSGAQPAKKLFFCGIQQKKFGNPCSM